MELYFAPMEGITGGRYRRTHRALFSGVDKYYMPFISPTQDHVFTPRELRNVAPENNVGVPAVPQLLTKNAVDFLWAAQELWAMGYREVNLNLGCPSGTVVAKGKGAGMLADPVKLDRFLEQVFSAPPDGLSVSLKTRLGLESPAEFPALLEVFAKYPISLLIIHPRVRTDYYRTPVRSEEFIKALPCVRCPVCYNGGITMAADCSRVETELPQVSALMLGQGLLADPALARQAKGGPPLTRGELSTFHDALYQGYLEDFGGQRNTAFHMKELWSYWSGLFLGGEKLFKQLKKAQNGPAYERAVARIFQELPLRQETE